MRSVANDLQKQHVCPSNVPPPLLLSRSFQEGPEFKFPTRSLLSVLQVYYSSNATADDSAVSVKLVENAFNFSAGAQQDGSGVVVSYATHTR